MIKKKCRGCGEKVERKFNYCPWCGASLKVKTDLGMLGDSDEGQVQEELKLPFGMDRIVGGLVKQLEKQLGNMDMNNANGGAMPKGFKIQIGMPTKGQAIQQKAPIKKRNEVVVSKEEGDRRAKLKKVEAKSRMRRLGDVIVYELETPNVRGNEDVVINELETGLEIRVYARDKCYVKVIPLKVEVLRFRVDKEKVLVEMRG